MARFLICQVRFRIRVLWPRQNRLRSSLFCLGLVCVIRGPNGFSKVWDSSDRQDAAAGPLLGEEAGRTAGASAPVRCRKTTAVYHVRKISTCELHFDSICWRHPGTETAHATLEKKTSPIPLWTVDKIFQHPIITQTDPNFSPRQHILRQRSTAPNPVTKHGGTFMGGDGSLAEGCFLTFLIGGTVPSAFDW